MAFIIDEKGNYIPVLGETSGGGGGSIGNGKITINQGGTKKGEFTVNQAGDETINLDAGGSSLTETGSATQPIYINEEGTPTATTYSLAKSVPSNAVFTDTTYSAFTGADGTNAGVAGLVPAPAATDNTKFLKGDGTWTSADSTFSNTSTNPVQNRTLYPIVGSFITPDTTYNVKTDGTGDFTNLYDAISFLEGKWSSGKVTLQLSEETFTLTNTLDIDCDKFNFTQLIIKGTSKTGTKLKRTTFDQSFQAIIKINNNRTTLIIQTLTVEGVKINNSSAFYIQNNSNFFLKNVYISNVSTGVNVYLSGNVYLQGGLQADTIDNYAIVDGSFLSIQPQTTLTFSNIGTVIMVVNGGMVTIRTATKAFTNVTNITNKTIGTISTDGFIIGNWSN